MAEPAGCAGTGLRFAVRDWYAWAPGRETREAWQAWAIACPLGDAVSGSGESELLTLPMMLRRRTTQVGKHAAAGVLAMGEAAATARYVLASRHGDLRRSLGILGAIARDEGPSPTEFSMAVHHGLTGLLSIHTSNRAGHTAVAADADVFGYGLIEAAACLAELPDQSILVIHCDDSLPDEYAPFRDAMDTRLPLVVVLHLAAPTTGESISLRREPEAATRGKPTSEDDLAEGFLCFLLTGADEGAVTGHEARWSWQRVGLAT